MTATINASTSAGVVTTADTSGILQLQTNGTAALTVDASQNVGIGTATPAFASGTGLEVEKTGDATVRVERSGATASAGEFVASSGLVKIGATGGVPFTFITDNTERMRISSVGLVGINTTSPARTLHVKGGGVTTLANSNGALFTDASNAGVLLGSDNVLGYISGVTVAGNATADLVLQPFGANVLVAGTANPNSGRIAVSGANSARFMSFVNSSNGSEIGYIQNNSGTAVIYSTSSDYRLKDNFQPMVGALDKVAQLKPCTYTWKSTGGLGQGFIAHELQAVVPDAVCGVKDEVNEDGNPVYQGIDTSFLVATLTAAIQELKAIVDAQGAEIAALKGATA